ncbi:MAG: PLP-dependent aminotransferase family protein [Acidobacteria bacterium]|nr:PLP-dependent aminotransferase family protein [Acidobacteriota bacterium]MBI3486796.1 PLP-dependent aminotransferase family protein [Acidobacteriota bacterium]
MRQRDFLLHISPEVRVPLFRRLAQAIAQSIREGRLRPGDALPGSRQLAGQTGANRKTVVEAIRELEAEGWVLSEPNRGTYVAPVLPERALPDAPGGIESPRSEVAGFEVPGHLDPLSAQVPGALYLAEGFPDPRLAPAAALAKGYQRALHRHGNRLLDFGEPMGSSHLREGLAGWLSARGGYPVQADEVLVTRGGTAAIALLGLALLEPGDSVAVEEPGNRQAWDALAQRGNIRLVPVRVDQEGLDPEDLERVLTRQRIRALYLTPRRQYPTTVPLSPARRRRILALSEHHGFAILEDDLDAEHGFQETLDPPLAMEDLGRRAIRVVSFSHLIAPGLHLGCVVAPAHLVDRLARLQRNLGWQGDRVLGWAVAELIRDGDLARQLRRARLVYGDRMVRLMNRLRGCFGSALAWDPPRGGLALWIRPGLPVSTAAWVMAARVRGLVLHSPSHFFLNGEGAGLRLGFAQHDLPTLDEAVLRLEAALEDAAAIASRGR